MTAQTRAFQNEQAGVGRRGIAAFLLITFGVTDTIEIALALDGFRRDARILVRLGDGGEHQGHAGQVEEDQAAEAVEQRQAEGLAVEGLGAVRIRDGKGDLSEGGEGHGRAPEGTRIKNNYYPDPGRIETRGQDGYYRNRAQITDEIMAN